MNRDKGQDKGKGALDHRLRSLEERLADARGEPVSEVDRKRSGENRSGFGKALKMSSEFISAILVGAGLGYFLDHFAGTAPWGMIVFLLLGFVAGVVNVLRSSGELADPYRSGWATGKGEEKRNSPANPPEEDEE